MGYSISTQSDTQITFPDNSIDYLLLDPPFGANIAYSELNSLMESWLQITTNQKSEAIEDRPQKKTVNEYRELMTKCFKEAYRVLKPGRWMTVVFSNRKASHLERDPGLVYSKPDLWSQRSRHSTKCGEATARRRPTYRREAGSRNLCIQAEWRARTTPRGAAAPAKSLLGISFGPTSDTFPSVVVKRSARFCGGARSAAHFDRMVAWFVRHDVPVPTLDTMSF